MSEQEAPPTIETNKNEIQTENNQMKKPEMSGNNILSREMQKYPQRLHSKFQFNFYGQNLEPDCIFMKNLRKYYVYFNLDALKNKLEEYMGDIFKNYPNNIDDIKNGLNEYMKFNQKEEFKDPIGFLGQSFNYLKCLYYKESYDEEIRVRAIKISYILAQLYSYLRRKEKDKEKYKTIGMIDTFNLELTCYSYQILDELEKECENINIKRDNDEEIIESLQLLEGTMNRLTEKIKNEFSEDDGQILISFIIKKIDNKLSKIEDSCRPKESDTYKKMELLRSKVNQYLLQNILREKSKDFFFNTEFEFKIIKNTKEEQITLLDGVNIANFYQALNKNFEDLRDHLWKFDINETDTSEVKIEDKMAFINKYMSKVEKLDDLKATIKKEINAQNRKMVNQIKDAKNTKNIDNAFNIIDINIDKQMKNKTLENIKYNAEATIKLIKEYELLEKLKKETKNIKESDKINGVLISREINDKKDQLKDLYSVNIIY